MLVGQEAGNRTVGGTCGQILGRILFTLEVVKHWSKELETLCHLQLWIYSKLSHARSWIAHSVGLV